MSGNNDRICKIARTYTVVKTLRAFRTNIPQDTKGIHDSGRRTPLHGTSDRAVPVHSCVIVLPSSPAAPSKKKDSGTHGIHSSRHIFFMLWWMRTDLDVCDQLITDSKNIIAGRSIFYLSWFPLATQPIWPTVFAANCWRHLKSQVPA